MSVPSGNVYGWCHIGIGRRPAARRRPRRQGTFPMPDTLPLNPLADDQKLLAQVIDYYCRTLKETTEGLDYLRSRGVTVGEAIDHFRIGYANRTLGLTLPTMDSKAGRDIRPVAASRPVPKQRPRTHERLYRVSNHGGRWQRSGGGHLRAEGRGTSSQGDALTHALVGPAQGVWNVEAFRAGNEIIRLRRPLRCTDVLERGLPQRDLHLWPRRLD